MKQKEKARPSDLRLASKILLGAIALLLFLDDDDLELRRHVAMQLDGHVRFA